MTLAATVSRFAKCGGDLHHLSRRFHNLPIEQRRIAATFISNGIAPELAIKQAKAPGECELCGAECEPGETRCVACKRIFDARKGFSAGGR